MNSPQLPLIGYRQSTSYFRTHIHIQIQMNKQTNMNKREQTHTKELTRMNKEIFNLLKNDKKTITAPYEFT